MDALADRIPLNWGLLKNPANWAIVLLMVLFACVAWDIIARAFATPAVSADN